MRLCLPIFLLALTGCATKFDQRFLSSGKGDPNVSMQMANYRMVVLVPDSSSQEDTALISTLERTITAAGTITVVPKSYVRKPDDWLVEVHGKGIFSQLQEPPVSAVVPQTTSLAKQSLPVYKRQGTAQVNATFTLADPTDPNAFNIAPRPYGVQKTGSTTSLPGQQPPPIDYAALFSDGVTEVCKSFVTDVFPYYQTAAYRVPVSKPLPDLKTGMDHLQGFIGGVRDPKKAEESFRAAIAQAESKNLKPAEQAKARFALGLALLGQGKITEALEELGKARNQDPKRNSFVDNVQVIFGTPPASYNYEDAYQRLQAIERARRVQEATPPQSVPTPPAPPKQTKTIHDSPSYIRSERSTAESTILQSLEAGDLVETFEQDGKWIRVKCPDGIIGWTLLSNFD